MLIYIGIYSMKKARLNRRAEEYGEELFVLHDGTDLTGARSRLPPRIRHHDGYGARERDGLPGLETTGECGPGCFQVGATGHRPGRAASRAQVLRSDQAGPDGVSGGAPTISFTHAA